ncbi:MAG: DUF3943 domain-containing protein [Prolixibacteraceae bacterium]|nr:DUF3943 domain-containing protein [Prolixibacteraceae bacterium]
MISYKRYLLIISCLFLNFFANGQILDEKRPATGTNLTLQIPDTLKSFWIPQKQPFLYNANMLHKEKTLFNKIVRANNCVIGYNLTMGLSLLIIPESISKWNVQEEFQLPKIRKQYINTYTSPPVFDHDMFIINYVGHPYQGSYYYNSMRSQNATILQSSLFCIAQSFLWEYVWEGGMEQPSIQDLITTPVGGILLGELVHVATMKMSRNGFEWYEIAITCIINPSYAFNNRFQFNKRKFKP